MHDCQALDWIGAKMELVRWGALTMHVEFHFRPTVPVIGIVRRCVMSLYENTLANRDVGARIALATQELLENVVRHSSDGEASLQIRAESAPARRVTIETSNRANPNDIASVEARTRAMVGVDPTTYYTDVITASLDSPAIGGLGLARIRAEAEMTVTVRTEGDRLSIVATLADWEAA
jgi:hypothetical protein